MTPTDKAAHLFDTGFSCAPAVLAAFAPRLGMDEAMALRIATGFGGGIANTQGLCGAVAGAVMALGLAYGRDDLHDKEPKYRTYQAVETFLERFEATHGSRTCKELLGVDHATASTKGLYHDTCTGLVRDAARIVEDLLDGPS